MKILVVDDDFEIANLINKYLTVEGYEVETAYNGEEGLAKFGKDGFSLVILDIMMEPGNGFEMIKRIRETDKEVMVFFLTAKDTEVDRVYGFRMGADDYIVKPFYINELVERVNARLKRSRKVEPETYKFGDFVVDFSAYKIHKRNKEVNLRAREFELLKFFILNKGRVFSKSQLFEHVWKQDYMGDDNTIMVHIRRLREKIEDVPEEPCYIKTVWGLGYRFEPEGN